MSYNRYGESKVTKDNKNKRRLTTTLLPKIERKADDIYIFARKGDRMDLLAYEYYGDPTEWIKIAKANNIGHGSIYVPTEIGQLRIPFDSSEYDEANKETNEER